MSLRIQDVDDSSHTNGQGCIDDLETSQHSLRQQASSSGLSSKNGGASAHGDQTKSTPDRIRADTAAEQDDDDDDDDEDAGVHAPGWDASSRPLLGHTSDAEAGSRKSDEENGSVYACQSSAMAGTASSPGLPAALSWLPPSWHAGAADLLSRYSELFTPEWKRTTVLIWIIWGGMSYGFTTFNVLLPKLLEQRYDSAVSSSTPAEPDDASIRRAMLDILVYSLSSLPGSLISAYMVETRLGRIGTMVSSTAVMAASVLLFSLTFWRSSLTLVSVSSSISYAAIYGYTPEVMAPTIRATACGTASAISRIAGIVAPLLAGWAFSLAPAIPLFMATSVLLVVTAAMALLPIETRGRALDAAQSTSDDTDAH